MPRILLVEDDIDVCTVLENILIDEAYEVDPTQTIRDGEEFLRCSTYDLLIADGRRRNGIGGSGGEIRYPCPDRDRIRLSYDGANQNPERYNALLKPIRRCELIEAVRAALERRPGGAG